MTADPWLVLARFGAACAGSLVLAWVLHALLRRAAVLWPALRAHRSVWLLAQAAIVMVFALAFVPVPRSDIAAVVTLPPAAVTATKAATQDHEAAPYHADADAGVRPPTGTSFTAPDVEQVALRWLPLIWAGVYLAGLAWHAARRLRTWRRWAFLLRQSHRIQATALRDGPAMTPAQRARIAASGLAVRTIGLPVSPMLYGLRKPCLLLPAHLSQLDIGQQQLIVEHELTHWQRRDPWWLVLSGMLSLLFWFNRPLQGLDAALREAVELGCDDAVLAGRTAAERQGYAAALVAQLRLQAGWNAPASAGAAFGALGVSGRVQRMRTARPPRLSRRGRMLAGAGIAGVVIAGGALQPAFSSGAPVAMEPPLALAAAIPAQPEYVRQAWRYPLARPRVTSLYGVRSPSRPKGHHGIDFAAPRGTPVFAVAEGRVAEAGFEPAWGHHVRVDHGGGRSSLLIHLERVDVVPGQAVLAGDPLGTSGASGKATGPHLHLEYWQDGQRLEPALVLPDLLRHATRKSIAQRQAQGNPVPTDL